MNKKIVARKRRAVNAFLREMSKKPESKLVERMILFGSVARGEADEESDIDLLLFTKEPKKIEKVSDDIEYAIFSDLGEFIQTHIYPLSQLTKPKSYFVLRATETGKEIYPNKSI